MLTASHIPTLRLLPVLLLALATALAWGIGLPNSADAQSLTFSSGGGPLTLTVSSATAGSNPTDASDATTDITWDGDFGVTAKITVATVCPSQAFGLYVTLAVTSWGSGTSGTEQSEIQLTDGMADADIFRDIPTTSPGRQGVATLTYRGSATAAQGNSADNGDDVHTVTYTILAQ
jgi:hypothetical protein